MATKKPKTPGKTKEVLFITKDDWKPKSNRSNNSDYELFELHKLEIGQSRHVPTTSKLFDYALSACRRFNRENPNNYLSFHNLKNVEGFVTHKVLRRVK